MSDAQMQSRQQAIDYMVRLLQMNPIHQGEEIISVRGKALGLAGRTDGAQAVSTEETPVDRRKLLDALEAVREEFWTTPIEELDGKLRGMGSHGFGDLAAAIDRLRVVAAHRAQFPKLAGKPGFDGDFFSALKEVLILSPRDTAVLREKVLSTFRNSSLRKSGRKMVALLKAEMPEIYALEEDWFETLNRQKSHLPSIRLTSSSGATAVGGGARARNYWWAPVVLISVVRLFIGIADRDRGSYTPSTPEYPLQNLERSLRRDYRPPQYDLPKDREAVIPRSNEPRKGRYFNPDSEAWKPYPSSSVPPSSTPFQNEFPTPDRYQNNFPTVPDLNPSPSFTYPNGRFE